MMQFIREHLYSVMIYSFSFYRGNPYTSQDVAIAPDEGYFLFGSQNTQVHSYTLEGELLWIRDVGPVSSIAISHDSEYILLGTSLHTPYLLDREGTILWEKTVTNAFFVDDIAISDHGEYCVVGVQKGSFLPLFAVQVYNTQGILLWEYEAEHSFIAVTISDNGQFVIAGCSEQVLFFDNSQAIQEYASSECSQAE